MPWQLQADYSHEQIESRESFRSKSGPHSKPFETDERVSIDFDGLWLELFQLPQAGLGSDYSFRWCPCILFNCSLIICIEQHWERVQEHRTFTFKDDVITECKNIVLFLMLLNFPCTVTQILHLGNHPSHYTRGRWLNRWGKLECWWTGNTVQVRITSVTIQTWLKIALIKLQQKNIFNCIFIRFKAVW